jgi:aminopeptidase N
MFGTTGASVIRMMNHFLGEKTFKQGLTNYLKAHKYSNARQDDLWQELTQQAHQDCSLPSNVTVKEIMDTWTLQTGYPVVTVTRNYMNGSAYISQVSCGAG